MNKMTACELGKTRLGCIYFIVILSLADIAAWMSKTTQKQYPTPLCWIFLLKITVSQMVVLIFTVSISGCQIQIGIEWTKIYTYAKFSNNGFLALVIFWGLQRQAACPWKGSPSKFKQHAYWAGNDSWGEQWNPCGAGDDLVKLLNLWFNTQSLSACKQSASNISSKVSGPVSRCFCPCFPWP